MDKLTAIKIKYDDGTYSDEIPISVLSENVEWDNTHTLVDVLGSIDVDVTGTIQDQISQLFNEKVTYAAMTDYVSNNMNTYITDWLNKNVNPVGSAVVVDNSLSIRGAAADAKVTGDKISNIYFDNFISGSYTINESLKGTQYKIYHFFPEGTILRFIYTNFEQDIPTGNVGSGLRFLYLDNGEEKVDPSYKATIAIETAPYVIKNVTVPFDCIGFIFYNLNSTADAEINKYRATVQMIINPDSDYHKSLKTWVDYSTNQTLSANQKETVYKNIDVVNSNYVQNLERLNAALSDNGFIFNYPEKYFKNRFIIIRKPWEIGDILKITITVLQADFTGSVAIGCYGINANNQKTGPYIASWDSQRSGSITKIITVAQSDYAGIVLEGLNISSDAVVNTYKIKINIESNLDLQNTIDTMNEQINNLKNNIDDVYNDFGLEDAFDLTHTHNKHSDWMHGPDRTSPYAAINYTFDKDVMISSMEFATSNDDWEAHPIEYVKCFVGTLDQRIWFLGRKEIIDISTQVIPRTSTYAHDIIVLTPSEPFLLKAGEVICLTVSIPNAINGNNVWAKTGNDNGTTYDSSYEIAKINKNTFVGTLSGQNFMYFKYHILPISSTYQSKENAKEMENSINLLQNQINNVGKINDTITGDLYKIIIANGNIMAKLLDYKKLYVIGHSFMQHASSEYAGWTRDDGDTTALCPTLKNRDFCGWLTKYGLTVYKQGGVDFEKNYSTSYDFSTIFSHLDDTYDAVLIFLGQNCTYHENMQESFEYFFTSLRNYMPTADIFASGGVISGDRYTALNAAINNCPFVTKIDTKAIMSQTTRNNSAQWEGGEYYIGRNNNYYPVKYVAASHPNDYGHYAIANAFLEAMGKKLLNETININLNQNNGGTISTANTHWFEDAVVSIRIEPNDGYRLSSLTVVDSNNNIISTTARDNTDGSGQGKVKYFYTFIMPNNEVTVTPTWELIS